MRKLYSLFLLLPLAINILPAAETECSTQTQNCCNFANLKPAAPILSCDIGLFVTADTFVWTSRESSLDYAVVQKFEDNTHTTPINGGHIKQPCSDWNWGFKVGIGIRFDCDGWDGHLEWTRFRSDQSNSVEPNDNELLAATYPNVFNSLTDPVVLQRARGSWRLDYDTLDLSIGRNTHWSCCLNLRPFFGLRAAWLDQGYKIKYEGTTGSTDLNFLSKLHLKSNFWGIGPRIGLDSKWNLGCGFGICADLSAALLWGVGDAHYHETRADDIDSSEEQHLRYDFDTSCRHTILSTDMGLFLCYDALLSSNRWRFGAKIGWEHHLFLEQNRFIHNELQESADSTIVIDPIYRNSSLGTQGWTLSLRLDF